MVNWNRVNNELSEAVLGVDGLEALLGELGCDVVAQNSGWRYRGACPVHRGDHENFEVRAEGHTLPIRWACFSNLCHTQAPLKNNLLGLVRGALGDGPDHPAGLHAARTFVEAFLSRGRPVV